MPPELYVVVHHRCDLSQPYSNSWIDDERIEAITTTNEIGELCAEAMSQGNLVFVHRCGWGEQQPIVSCAATVDEVATVDKRTKLVTFAAQRTIGAVPSISPRVGQSYYFA